MSDIAAQFLRRLVLPVALLLTVMVLLGMLVTRVFRGMALGISGTVNDLYLLLWNRLGEDRAELRGDRAVLELWRNKAHVTWS